MSSDHYTFDIPFHRHSNTDMDGNGITDLFFSDPYPFHLSSYFFSPPNVQDGTNINSDFGNFSALEESREKSVEYQMQRSYSCNSFDAKPGFPHRDALGRDSSNIEWSALSSPEHSFFSEQIRRACSAGDLQDVKSTHSSQRESPLLEEANFKVGRYSAEERREKISKYRAKRSQRKFNKIIKYACRKTLADNRTRIRGRFASKDGTNEIPKAPCSTTAQEHEDEFWVQFLEGLKDELLR